MALSHVARTIVILLSRVLLGAIVLLAPARAFAAVEGTVVLVTPEAPDLDAALRDAATAQFSGSSVELVIQHFRPPEETLRAQAEAARLIAAEAHAAGVFWLDVRAKGEWLLYLAEPLGKRLLMRRVPLENEAMAAGAESVAVIVRQSTEALLSGQTISMQPILLPEEKPAVCPEPAPAKVAPKAKSKRGEPRLGAMFYGDTFASSVGFQGGVRVAAEWLTHVGFYGALGYTYVRDDLVTTPDIAFRIRRTPFDVGIGYAFLRGRIVPSLEVRAMMDWVTRKNGATVQGLSRTPENTRPVFSVSPRARVDVGLVGGAAAHLALGPDLVLNTFSYVIRADSRDVTVLEPYRLRPAVELGITVRL